jgi:hypothetical protein
MYIPNDVSGYLLSVPSTVTVWCFPTTARRRPGCCCSADAVPAPPERRPVGSCRRGSTPASGCGGFPFSARRRRGYCLISRNLRRPEKARKHVDISACFRARRRVLCGLRVKITSAMELPHLGTGWAASAVNSGCRYAVSSICWTCRGEISPLTQCLPFVGRSNTCSRVTRANA